MPPPPATLYFLCGKMAAGKSTHAQALAQQHQAVLWVQDELLETLYPGEILNLGDFERCSARLRAALGPGVQAVLHRGIDVVLDFPGNTVRQRQWFRALFEGAGAAHELHWVDASDARCKRQLRQRSAHLPPGSPWTTEAEFDAVTAFFQAPTADEGFHVVHWPRS
ncbi:AAA family ATPase [Inhella gelatinilytica]|uniref:ATP-binding protein n=1 Tax=Inhella gelatinilytica TaxID=2795030 RepID=A0A931NDD1_9BURK|nr:ATP-binding protein [Inhella gelatinilytica]MBH9552110.1 ATP-binding protein [Inhella gelatinilytica]